MLEDKLIVCSTALFTYMHIYGIVKSRSAINAEPEKKQEDQEQQQIQQVPQKHPLKGPEEIVEEQPHDQLEGEQMTQLYSTLRQNLVPMAIGLTAVCVLKTIIN
ncbi:uncharacterized protein LOC108152006 [Drosophila miranda]|uniref:uncharacterized protein LOC108152006 n=1 Tax=Drosophila miranda TaxID=7229 RepID=UPI0007E679AE|nr:uncharacterized protein LOC108152006 [Drosophila miranda]